jgi:hypothetical protein
MYRIYMSSTGKTVLSGSWKLLDYKLPCFRWLSIPLWRTETSASLNSTNKKHVSKLYSLFLNQMLNNKNTISTRVRFSEPILLFGYEWFHHSCNYSYYNFCIYFIGCTYKAYSPIITAICSIPSPLWLYSTICHKIKM